MNFFKFKNRNILKVIITMALISIFTTVTVFATPVEEVEVHTTYSFSTFTLRPQVNLVYSNGDTVTYLGSEADGFLSGVAGYNFVTYNHDYYSVSPMHLIGMGPFKSLTFSSGGSLGSNGVWYLKKGAYANIPFSVSINATTSGSGADPGFNISDVRPVLLLYTDIERKHWINCPLSDFSDGFTVAPDFFPEYLGSGQFHFTVPEDLTIYGFYFNFQCSLYSTTDYPLGALNFRFYDFNTVYKGPDYIVQVSPPPSIDQAIFEEYEANLLEGSRELLSSHKPDFNLNLSSLPKLASSMLGFSYLIENLYNIDFIRVLFYFSVGLGGVGFLIGLAQHAVGSLGSYTSKSKRSSNFKRRNGG